MARNEEIVFDVAKFIRRNKITVRYKNINKSALRIRACGLLIRLAVWVGGFGGVDILERSDEEDGTED